MLYGTTNWTALAQHMVDPDGGDCRSGKQCRERWHNHLNPTISKVEWTTQEDATIVYLQKMWGNQWAKIAKYLPGRSDNAVKNRYHATCRSKYQNYDFSDLNLPLFVEDAQPVVEASAIPAAAAPARGSMGSAASVGKTTDEESYGSEDELDFDQHVQKIKNYTGSMAVPVPHGADATYLRDDIASSPLTNTSMSLGELALDELMEDDDEQHMGGMGGAFTDAVMVEPVAFSSYELGSNKFESAGAADESSGAGCNANGFCGQWSAPAASFSSAMASMCDFGGMASSSYDEHEQDEYYGNAQPAFVCDVVGTAPAQQQQQQHTVFSPSMAFCAPRR